MKYLLVIILSLCYLLAFATDDALTWLGYEPSSINLSLGGGTGVANIWNNNPLGSYANPAIPAFHEGFSYGYTEIKSNYPEGSMMSYRDNSLSYNVSLVNMGYKGIALTLPGLNALNKFGIDYGQNWIDVNNNNYLEAMHSHETGAVFGVSANIIELIRNHTTINRILDHFDLAIGLNEVRVKSVLAPFSPDALTFNNQLSSAWSMDLGALAKYSYNLDDTFNFEAVYGISNFNFDHSKIKFEQKLADPIFRQDNQGYAFSVSLLSPKVLPMGYNPKKVFFENIITMRDLASYISDDNSDDVRGHGFEVGFLDTFYLRTGHYRDKTRHFNYTTNGYGFNLHYKNLFSLSYNYAETPAEMSISEHSVDYCMSFDFVNIYKKLKTKN